MNALPLVGPVVINELMFDPPLLGLEDDTQDEYLELKNITPSPVPLFDPQAATNTWKVAGGVAFTFPQNVTLPAGGILLLVNFDPTVDLDYAGRLPRAYNLGPAVPLYGPYTGHLANGGESLALYKPDSAATAATSRRGLCPLHPGRANRLHEWCPMARGCRRHGLLPAAECRLQLRQ